MTRDMKPRKQQPAKKKSAGGTLVGMFIGLILGVGVAAGVVWYMNKAPLPFVTKPLGKTEANPQPAVHGNGESAKPGTPPQPVALPGKPGDPVPEKRFQFYDILPGKSAPVPEKPEAAAPAKDKDKGKETPKVEESKESKQPLFLQAGSFNSPQEADNQKAKLAMMGMEAVIQQVMLQDKTFYRVRVGPYNRIEDLNKVRSELAKSGIEAQLAKNKE